MGVNSYRFVAHVCCATDINVGIALNGINANQGSVAISIDGVMLDCFAACRQLLQASYDLHQRRSHMRGDCQFPGWCMSDVSAY